MTSFWAGKRKVTGDRCHTAAKAAAVRQRFCPVKPTAAERGSGQAAVRERSALSEKRCPSAVKKITAVLGAVRGKK